jgi:hypothetical protein
MTHPFANVKWLVPGLAALTLVACGQQQGQSTATAIQTVEKTFTLTPGATPLKVDFLVGQLQQLTITERLDSRTGRVVDPPALRGTLTIKNTSQNQAALLIAGKLVFLDAKGQVVSPAKGRGEALLPFGSYEPQRLVPGQEIARAIDVSFPRAGLQADVVQTVRLDLTYLPTPVREQTADTPVSIRG